MGGLLALTLWALSAQADPTGDPARGERLAGLAGCPACHTAEDGPLFAGGHVLDTRWGTFVGSNLTPDPTHGIGDWSYEDFHRAMRHGRSPEGRPYYPSFPYTAFTGITDEDLRDLWAYLQTVEPVANDPGEHDLNGIYGWRFLLRFWKITGFSKGPWERPKRLEDDQLARGAYLGEAIGHCGECHTPRKALGNLKKRKALGGSDGPESSAPNITPSADGIGEWSHGELVSFFVDGMLPDGDVTGGEMWRLVKEGTAKLSDADREALAAWVLAHEPVEARGKQADAEDEEDEYEFDF